MAQFTYTARNRKGEKQDGALEAADRREALRLLERQGLIPVSVTDRGAVAAAPDAKKGFVLWHGHTARMSSRDLLIFTTELSDLLAAGMTLGNALNTLANRKSGRPADRIIGLLRDEIVRGASLSDAMATQPRTFSRLYSSMIRAGEASGALGEVLRRLVSHYERMQDIREKVTMALVYPMIVLFMGFGTLVFSMIYVVPKFEEVFRQMNTALPISTQILLNASRWMVQYGWLLLGAGGVAGALAYRALRTAGGRRWKDGLLLRMPLIRGVVASGIFANFARTLETLLANGVPALQALGIVEQTVGNVVIAAEVRKARDRVTDGTTISGPMAAGKLFPPAMIDMLSVGEQTGDMAGALSHIGRRYENELIRNLKIFTTALEPILIVLVAVVVGFIAISILQAVFSLSGSMSQ